MSLSTARFAPSLSIINPFISSSLSVLSNPKRERVPLGQRNPFSELFKDWPAAPLLLDERQVHLGSQHFEGRGGRVDRGVEAEGF